MDLLQILNPQAPQVPFRRVDGGVPQDPLEVVEVPASPQIIDRKRTTKRMPERGAGGAGFDRHAEWRRFCAQAATLAEARRGSGGAGRRSRGTGESGGGGRVGAVETGPLRADRREKRRRFIDNNRVIV